jgi:hypothetical protein
VPKARRQMGFTFGVLRYHCVDPPCPARSTVLPYPAIRQVTTIAPAVFPTRQPAVAPRPEPGLFAVGCDITSKSCWVLMGCLLDSHVRHRTHDNTSSVSSTKVADCRKAALLSTTLGATITSPRGYSHKWLPKPPNSAGPKQLVKRQNWQNDQQHTTKASNVSRATAR